MPANARRPINLEIGDGLEVDVDTLQGVDELSKPWRFVVRFTHDATDLNLEEVLTKPAAVQIRAPAGTGIHRTAAWKGCLESIRQMDTPSLQPGGATRYEAVIVPNLWKLGLTVQTRIFLDKSVKAVVEEVLKEYGFAASDFDFQAKEGPKREFIVQYQESDLDFVSRWLEHEGIAYAFRETQDGEQVVFFDSTAGYVEVPGKYEVEYSPQNAHRSAESDPWSEEYVNAFNAEVSVLPAKVLLRDYNWRKPSDDIKTEAEAVKDGQGFVYLYAEHYKDKKEGDSIALARADEIKCGRKVLDGTSNHKSFRAGLKFKLVRHPRQDFAAEYVLTRVEHNADQAGARDQHVAPLVGSKYENTFEAIPAEQAFRPERETEWPSIHGFMHGKVDAGGSGEYAEIDDMGRYKVMLPFDMSGRDAGKASRFVRMMQPYSGGNMGMHFPLHKGTEVLLAFLDGDPDRPIIIGSVPNPETGSPVTSANQTQCKILTGGGNQITIEDNDGGQRIFMSSPTGKTYFSIGAPPA